MKIGDKIKDFFDVKKYKKQRNTAINKYEARNDDYIVALETVQTLVNQNVEYQKQIEKLKLENIAISMADNKKDKRPVTRTLFKAAKKQEEINKYALKMDDAIEVKQIELDLDDIKVEELNENTKVLAINKKTKKSHKKNDNNESRNFGGV